MLLCGRMRHTQWSREKSLKNVVEKAEAFTDLFQLQKRTLLVVGLRDRQQYIENLKSIDVTDVVTVMQEDVSHHSPVRRPRLIKSAVLNFVEQ